MSFTLIEIIAAEHKWNKSYPFQSLATFWSKLGTDGRQTLAPYNQGDSGHSERFLCSFFLFVRL